MAKRIKLNLHLFIGAALLLALLKVLNVVGMSWWLVFLPIVFPIGVVIGYIAIFMTQKRK